MCIVHVLSNNWMIYTFFKYIDKKEVIWFGNRGIYRYVQKDTNYSMTITSKV